MMPYSGRYRLDIEARTKAIFNIPHTPPNVYIGSVCDWLQGDKNSKERVEHLYHNLWRDHLFLTPNGNLNCNVKHEYLRLRVELRENLAQASAGDMVYYLAPISRRLGRKRSMAGFELE